jgi:hypothetical protein
MGSNIKALFFIMLVIILAFNIIGCTKEDGSSSVTNPSPSTYAPTGTIQGNLVDAVTQQPIVGAIVDVGVGQATTSSTGEFVIYNVPATTDSLNSTVSGAYQVTVDLRNVTSPVLMSSSTATYKYPAFSYSTVSVTYTTLNSATSSTIASTETSTSSATSTDGGNGQVTPVSGLVAPLPLTVGKLASNIVGVVAYSNMSTTNALQPVAAGWTVQLVSIGSNNAATPDASGTAGTGNTGNVVATTTTGANGNFTFNNIESMQTFKIEAWDPTNTFYGTENVTSVADGQTLTLVPQTTMNSTVLNQAVLVNSIDNVAPFIIAVTPAVGSDINPVGGMNVIYTFSEPIEQGPYALCLTNSGLAGSCLYQDINVTFNGAKAGNIEYALSWNAADTQLTVNIPTLAPSSKYTVDMTNALGVGKLTDISSNSTSSTDPKRIVTFTTNGGVTAAVPVNLEITNSASIDYNSSVTLAWLPASGAVSYNIYRMPVQIWSGATQTLTARLIGNTAITTFTDNFADAGGVLGALSHDLPASNILAGITFDELINIQLQYVYNVVGVNTDHVQGPTSASVTATDVIGADLVDPGAATTFGDLTDGNNTITVYFDEPLDEVSAQTASNYTIAPGSITTNPTISLATYNGWNAGTNRSSVTLTLSAAMNPANIVRSYISTGADGICQTTAAALDAQRIPVGSGGLCIAPGNANGTLNTPAATGDDVRIAAAVSNQPPIGIYAGANNTCDTAVTAPDIQVVAVAAHPAANQPCVSAASYTAVGNALNINSAVQSDFTLQTVPFAGSDDAVVNQVLVTVGAGVKDYAGNALNLGRTVNAFSHLNTNLTIN